MVEVLTGYETENRYKVFARSMPENVPLLQARETSTCCSRSCLGAKRPFEMTIFSPQTKALVMKLVRPYKCCLSEMQVLDGRAQVLGWVKQQCVACARSLLLYDNSGKVVYEIYGPWYVVLNLYAILRFCSCSPWQFGVMLPRTSDGKGMYCVQLMTSF